ncbi:MAG: hypothetical protein R3E65_08740 [Steroidobacteraceae bacterium]
MFESGAVLIYAAERAGRFLPQGTAAPRLAVRWLFWQVGGLGPMARPGASLPRVRAEVVPCSIQALYRRVQPPVRRARPARLAIATTSRASIDRRHGDLAAWIVPHERQGQDLRQFPNVAAWFERIRLRPAVERAYAVGQDLHADADAYRFLYGQTARSAEELQRDDRDHPASLRRLAIHAEGTAHAGLEGLSGRSVRTPMLPPKDSLRRADGRLPRQSCRSARTCTSTLQRIALELERRHPCADPTFPGGDPGIAQMLVKWSETFFRTGLAISVNLLAKDWPEQFRADREALFPDFDFKGALRDATHAQSQFRVHAGWLDSQLKVRGPFLTGAAPGLADIQAHVFVWMARAYFPELAARLLAPFDTLAAWEQAMLAIGEGQRQEITAATSTRRSTRPKHGGEWDGRHGRSGRIAGRPACRSDPGRYPRCAAGRLRGELASLDWRGITLLRSDPRCGQVAVHFSADWLHRVSALPA